MYTLYPMSIPSMNHIQCSEYADQFREKYTVYLRMVWNGFVTFVSSHGGLMNLTPGGGAKPFPPGNKKKG